jgi:hypothetical protein
VQPYGAVGLVDVYDEAWVEQAAAVLEVDPDLSALRDRLVPRTVSEARFWQVRRWIFFCLFFSFWQGAHMRAAGVAPHSAVIPTKAYSLPEGAHIPHTP